MKRTHDLGEYVPQAKAPGKQQKDTGGLWHLQGVLMNLKRQGKGWGRGDGADQITGTLTCRAPSQGLTEITWCKLGKEIGVQLPLASTTCRTVTLHLGRSIGVEN